MTSVFKPSLQASFLKNKRVVLSVMLTAALCLVFWLSSRYPALNEKAIMGGDTSFSGIGFDVLVEVDPTDSVVWKVVGNTINWAYTNKQGMTFGILLAAALMTLLPLFGQRRFKSRIANTLSGVLIGTPLGVCVNCATPIAQGIQFAGGRAEMMLATLFSSPTLNFIVVSMLLSLLPLHLALTKIVLTLVFIVFGVPFLTAVLKIDAQTVATSRVDEKVPSRQRFQLFDSDAFSFTTSDSWPQAALWVLKRFGRNLWQIIKIAVPLMLLAGFLGSIFITIVPFDALVDLLPKSRGVTTLIIMGMVALLGVFLPVPMAFDVIITIILIEAGLPIKYAMVLLFSLGIFSVYPFFVIWESVSKPLASLIFVLVAVFGVVSGTVGHYLHKNIVSNEVAILFENFESEVAGFSLVSPTTLASDQAAVVAGLNVQSAVVGAVVSAENDPTSTLQALGGWDSANNAQQETQFSRLWGSEIGLNDQPPLSAMQFYEPFSYGRAIASGDVHGDGWVDIAVVEARGLVLHANQNGTGWTQQPIDIPQFKSAHIISVALVDLNNDGWLDIFATTFLQGNFIAYSDAGQFTASNLVELPNVDNAVVTIAPGFADVDYDGDLDIFLGNWTLGALVKRLSYDSSQNALLINNQESFALQPLPGINGETLTSHFTDFNHDGFVDLIVGNDFGIPDSFYVGSQTGEFSLVGKPSNLFAETTQSTMSIISADINNDLTPEIYAAQISMTDEMAESSGSPCFGEPNSHQFLDCEQNWQDAGELNSVQLASSCVRLSAELYPSCLTMQLLQTVRNSNENELCRHISTEWSFLRFLCIGINKGTGQPAIPFADAVDTDFEIEQQLDDNILYTFSATDGWQNVTPEYNLEKGNWSWNSKFADLDNDGWQDLYIANGITGFSGRKALLTTNQFFHNQAGETFADKTGEFGLTSEFNTGAYTTIDFDNDGDLDVITAPSLAELIVFRNDGSVGNSIAIELNDELGNFYGIGSTVIVHTDANQAFMRTIQASGGFYSFDAPLAFFGLGDASQIERIEVQWSTGESSQFDGPLDVNQKVVISRQP